MKSSITKIRITAAACGAVMCMMALASCGQTAENNDVPISSESISEPTETEGTSEAETAETEETTTPIISEVSEITTSETETEPPAETAAPISLEAYSGQYEIYSPEVFPGVPDVCDIAEINTKRRDDMYKYGEPFCYYDYSGDEAKLISLNPAEYAEEEFEFSFENASPTLSYVKADFDKDGNDEYYLCMAEFLKHIFYENPTTTYYYDDKLMTFNNYVVNAMISVYYIDDSGESTFAFGKLWDYASPEAPDDTDIDEIFSRDCEFTVSCGYDYYLKPQIIDYGDSLQLFWDQGISYPMDYGAELFLQDKHIRIEYSEPAPKLGGFVDYEVLEYGISAEEQAEFLLSGCILADADKAYLDKNHFIRWNGSEYVYSCILFNKDNGTAEWEVMDEPIPWEEHT